MVKKSFETFKEYAQRWRELTAQVAPSLHEKKMITMFVETSETPFYERVLGSVSSNFSDLVIIGERIEHGLKSRKIAQGSSVATNARNPGFNNNNNNKKKERCKQLPPCHTGEDISANTCLIIDLHLLMLQMLCRATFRMLLSHQLHIDLQLQLTMHISLILEVRILIKCRIKAMVREVIKEKGW